MSESSSHNVSWSVLSALVIVCLAYLGYSGIENYSKTPKWIGVLLVLIVAMFTQRNKGFKWSLGLSVWSVFSIQYLLQTTNSYNTFDALSNSIPIIIGPLLIIGLFRKKNISTQLGQFSLLLAVLTAPILLYGFFELTELLTADDYTRTSSYGIRFSFGHRNQLAQFFTLLIPIYFLGIGLSHQKWKKVFLICSIAAVYLFVSLLMNRTSMILLYGLFPLVIIVFLIHTRLSGSLKRTAYFGLSAVVTLGMILLFFIPEHIPFVGSWMNSESGSERLMIWQNSLELVKESLIFGHGSGNWKIEILRTSLERPGFENQLFFQRAHNEFIHRLVENGIVGTLLLGLFFVFSILRVIRSSIDFNLKLFSISGVIGFLIISNLSFPLERVELIFLLFLFLLPTFTHFETPKLTFKFIPVAVAILCLFFSIHWIKQESDFFVYRTENDLDRFEALNTFTIDASSTPVAFYMGNYHFTRQNYEEAADFFSKAYQHNPYHVHVLNNLASSQSLIGQIEESKETYALLFELDSLFVDGLLNAASVHFNSGDTPKALDYLIRIPPSKEPENFNLFALTIMRSQLERLKAEKSTSTEFEKRINEIMGSESEVLALFDTIRSGASLRNAIDKRKMLNSSQ